MNKLPLILLVSLLMLVGCQSDTSTDTAKEAVKKVETVAVAKAKDAVAEKNTEVDEDSGAALHKANCSRCHGEGYYPKKPESKMTSYDGLHKMVAMCDAQLGTELFPDELKKIGDYLNDSFYKFSK